MALRLAAAFANDGADESPGSAMKNFIKGKTAAISEAVTPAISGATASISAAVTPAPGPGMSLAEIIDEVRTLRADNVQLREERSLRQRAWYYTRVFTDPKDADTVYVLNVGMHPSTDGGKTFGRLRPPHGHNHDLWIDPRDPDRMIQSNDGGANVSTDGGETWSRQSNQPTAQFYRITVDDDRLSCGDVGRAPRRKRAARPRPTPRGAPSPL